MDKVNIFAATTIKGPSKQAAVGHFIIELIHDGVSHTYPPPGKDTFIYRESTTATSLTIELFVNALYILPYILKKTSEVESITCWMDETAQGPFCNRWFDKWQKDGWLTAKGDPVKDREKWQQLVESMEKVSKRFIFTADHNSYRDLMQFQAKQELEKRKTLEFVHEKRKAAGL